MRIFLLRDNTLKNQLGAEFAIVKVFASRYGLKRKP